MLKILETLKTGLPRWFENRSLAAHFWLLLPLVILTMWPTGVIVDNEEAAFYRALFLVQPEMFVGEHAIFPSSMARFVSEYLFGTTALMCGVDCAVSVWRVVTSLVLTAGLAVLVASLGTTVLSSVAALAAFVVLGQDLIGGEWVFLSVESKSVAYGFVLASLGWSLQRRDRLADSMLIIATYLHFLVGGFWMVFTWVYRLIRYRDLKGLSWQIARYIIFVLPLVVLLGIEQLAGSAMTEGMEEATRNIYGGMRNVLHVAPFASALTTWNWLDGIVLAGATAAALWVVKVSEANGPARDFSTAILLGFAYLLFALILAWLDRDTHYLARFFLFRPSSLLLLLSCIAFFSWVERYGSSSGRINVALAIFVIPLFCWKVLSEKAEEVVWTLPKLEQVRELAEAVHKTTAEGDLILVQPALDGGSPYASIPRMLERPTYVNWKLMAHDPGDMIEWKKRMDAREHTFAEGCAQSQPPVDFDYAVGIQAPAESGILSCGTVVWQSETYWILERNREENPAGGPAMAGLDQ